MPRDVVMTTTFNGFEGGLQVKCRSITHEVLKNIWLIAAELHRPWPHPVRLFFYSFREELCVPQYKVVMAYSMTEVCFVMYKSVYM